MTSLSEVHTDICIAQIADISEVELNEVRQALASAGINADKIELDSANIAWNRFTIFLVNVLRIRKYLNLVHQLPYLTSAAIFLDDKLQNVLRAPVTGIFNSCTREILINEGDNGEIDLSNIWGRYLTHIERREFKEAIAFFFSHEEIMTNIYEKIFTIEPFSVEFLKAAVLAVLNHHLPEVSNYLLVHANGDSTGALKRIAADSMTLGDVTGYQDAILNVLGGIFEPFEILGIQFPEPDPNADAEV